MLEEVGGWKWWRSIISPGGWLLGPRVSSFLPSTSTVCSSAAVEPNKAEVCDCEGYGLQRSLCFCFVCSSLTLNMFQMRRDEKMPHTRADPEPRHCLTHSGNRVKAGSDAFRGNWSFSEVDVSWHHTVHL